MSKPSKLAVVPQTNEEKENWRSTLARVNREFALEKTKNEENLLKDMTALQNFLRRADKVGGRITGPQKNGPDLIRYGVINPYRILIIVVSGLMMFAFVRFLDSWILIDGHDEDSTATIGGEF